MLATSACSTHRSIALGLTSPSSNQSAQNNQSALSSQSKQRAQSVSAKALPTLTNDAPAACTPNESVTSQGGRYSANVDLVSSVALPGESGVDVVMTGKGAIAAVNRSAGSMLHWINPTTGEIAQTIELSSAISDLAFDGKGALVLAADNKILKLDITSGKVLSEQALAGVSRVAISPDGYVGAIAGKTVHLYDAKGAEILSKLRDYTEVTDVEVLSCDGSQLLYVTSFRNTSFLDNKNERNPVQIARLEAIDFTGEVKWSLFSDSAETIHQNVADTRLYRVTLGRDGYLYTAGESAGTATIFRWRGQPMSEDEQYGRTDAFLSEIDVHSQLHNSGSAHLPYYARVHPTQGVLVNSQMSFPRRENRKANAMRLGDIAIASNGALYFGGAASASIFNREALTLNGQPVGGYGGGDRTWMAIAPDFSTRNFWTVLAGEGGKGAVQGVDAGYGYSAALSNAESGTVPVTRGEATGKVFVSFTAE
jgi:hypothetical protein